MEFQLVLVFLLINLRANHSWCSAAN